jgi:replicative DNA helicase
MDLPGKIPPHSLEAERSVLGALMLDREAILQVADLLVPEDFYEPANVEIFRAILNLFNKRAAIDLLTTANVLKENNQLDTVGGEPYLAELTNEVPTASHAFHYALIVKRKSTLRRLIRAGHDITALGYEEAEEVDELLDKAEKALFTVSQTFLKDRFISIADILNARYEEFAELHAAEDKTLKRGVPTGFSAVDHILSGFKPADFVVLAGRPSMGKTALALSIALNAALNKEKPKSVAIFSFEMSKEQLVDRMFASLLGVDSWKLNHGRLSDEEFSRIGGVMDELSHAKIFLDDAPISSMTEIRAKARRLQMEHGLDLIVIDYLQLMSLTSAWRASTNRVQEIGEISRGLKGIARELHVPVLALSQLSRAVENRPGKIPQLSDLRESGAIEQDADVVMMMYREDYYEEDSSRPGVTDIYIRKHRNGPVGRVELMFKKEQMRFYDIDKKHAPPSAKGMGGAKNTEANLEFEEF